jgi:iron complex outermembrane recepter protein
VKLTAGLRVTRDEKSRVGEYFFANEAQPRFSYTHAPQNDSGSWSKPTVHFAAEYMPSSAMMNYLRYDTAYKSGGFFSSITAAAATCNSRATRHRKVRRGP